MNMYMQQIIDRDAEQAAFTLLYSHGLAPPVYCTFTNGFVCGYFPGVAIGPELVSDIRVYPKIAARYSHVCNSHDLYSSS